MLTACGGQSAPETAPPAGIEACVTSQLKVSLSDTGALAGRPAVPLKFTNDSRTPCHMSGWPVVTGLTAAGKASPCSTRSQPCSAPGTTPPRRPL